MAGPLWKPAEVPGGMSGPVPPDPAVSELGAWKSGVFLPCVC